MLYAAIDIHKHAFQAAVLDPESGEVTEHAQLALDDRAPEQDAPGHPPEQAPAPSEYSTARGRGYAGLHLARGWPGDFWLAARAPRRSPPANGRTTTRRRGAPAGKAAGCAR